MKKRLIITALLACLMTLMAVPQAMATRPSVGTTITNTVTANYNDTIGTPMPQESASVNITVLQVFSVLVSPSSDTKTGYNDMSVTYTFTVQNTGNGSDTFDLASAHQAGSSSWAPTSVTFYSDSGLTTSITNTGLMVEAATKTVYAKVIIPNSVTAPNGTTSLEWLKATSRGDTGQSSYNAATTTVGVAELDTSTKTSDKASYVAGETVTYTIHIVNDGLLDATNVTVTDVIPSNLTYLTTSPGSYDAGTKTVTVNHGTLAGGASFDITITARVNAGIIDQTSITNTAAWTYNSGALPESENKTCTITINAPKLDVSKAANPTSAKPGDTVEYTITITNVGHDTAKNVSIADIIPTTYLAFGAIGTQTNCTASQSGGTVTAAPLTGPGTLAPGASMTFKFTVTVRTS